MGNPSHQVRRGQPIDLGDVSDELHVREPVPKNGLSCRPDLTQESCRMTRHVQAVLDAAHSREEPDGPEKVGASASTASGRSSSWITIARVSSVASL